MNSIAQFIKIIHHVFKKLIFHICDQFFNNIEMKKLKINYKKIEILFNIQQFMFKHI